MRIFLLIFLFFFITNIFSFDIVDLSCQAHIGRNDIIGHVQNKSVNLFTEYRENPYGPIKNIPPVITISFVLNMTNEGFSKASTIHSHFYAICHLDNDSVKEINGGYISYQHNFIFNGTNHKLVNFSFDSRSFDISKTIPQNAESCQILDFIFVGTGNYKGNEYNRCDNASIPGLTYVENDGFSKTFSPIAFSDYNSWNITEELIKSSNNQNFLLVIVTILTSGLTSGLINILFKIRLNKPIKNK